MKRLFYIFPFLFSVQFFLFGCGGDTCPSVLVVADSLIKVAPDSALRYLESLDGEMASASESSRMYYRLLCIKATDKAYIPHTSDSLILPVLRYYEKKDKRHLVEARYYAGRVYRDLGDAPQALDYFGKALEALPAEGTHDMEGYVYSEMGTLFFYQDMRQEALQMFRNALRYDSLRKDSAGLVYDYRDIADCYHYQSEQTDSALLYYRKASEVAKAMRDRELSDMISNQMAALYTYTGEYEKARDMLALSREETNPLSKSSVYSIASKLYHKIGETDSALYFYRGMLDFGTVYAKRAAHQGMAQLALMNHEPETAMHHLLQERAYADSILKQTNTEAIHKMHSLYNYQLREKENLRLEAESQKRLTMIYVMLLAGAFILALFFGYLQYSRRKSLQQEIQIEQLRRIERENRERIASLEACQSQKEKLAGNLLRTASATDNRHADMQKRKLELINRILEQEKVETAQEAEARQLLFSSALYGQLQVRASSARGEANISSEEWDVLHELISSAFPRFFERLSALCITLNDNERHVCILTKIQFRPADIARLLGLKRETVSSVRTRLYKKVTGENGTAEKWDKILLAL